MLTWLAAVLSCKVGVGSTVCSVHQVQCCVTVVLPDSCWG